MRPAFPGGQAMPSQTASGGRSPASTSKVDDRRRSASPVSESTISSIAARRAVNRLAYKRPPFNEPRQLSVGALSHQLPLRHNRRRHPVGLQRPRELLAAVVSAPRTAR